MRQTIRQWTGLPVCVGIGSTKTLAKLANHIAKKNAPFGGVCDLNAMTDEQQDDWLSRIDVGEVWGIGRRLTPRLADVGIRSVLDLKQADPATLRSQFSVMLEKTIRELNGIVCIELEEMAAQKKQIVSSRSFGVLVSDLESLRESITLYVSRAAEKLRRQQSYAGSVHVFIHTSPHNPKEPYYGNSLTVPLPSATDDTIRLVNAALWGLKRIYKPGYRYQKAGVMLSELVPQEGVQNDLFSTAPTSTRSSKLMAVLDQINRGMGKRTLRLASEGVQQPWKMKQGNKSPSYTTRWDELPVCIL